MRKICLMGASLDTGNMGVSALAFSLIKLMAQQDRQIQISLLLGRHRSDSRLLTFGDRICRVDIVNYRLSPFARLQEHIVWILFLALIHRFIPWQALRDRIVASNRWLREIHHSEFVGSIHGGDSFSDIYGLRLFVQTVLPDLSVLLMKKKLILLPQTYGPYATQLSKRAFRLIANDAFKVFSRDKAGVAFVKQNISRRHHQKVKFCPDVAFTLPAKPPENIHIDPPLRQDIGSALVGINVSGLLYHGEYRKKYMFRLRFDYKRFVLDLTSLLLRRQGTRLLLVPHTFARPGQIEDDAASCAQVFRKLVGEFNGRVHLLRGRYDPSELKKIISLCDFFVGSRMHACIAALSQGIPTVGVAYSQKFTGVFESVLAGDCVVDAGSVDPGIACARIIEQFEHREQLKIRLEKRAILLQAKVAESMKAERLVQ